MRMRAGYRACGGTEIFTAVGDGTLGPDVPDLLEQLSAMPAV
jgi:hypothetical protein